MTPVAAGGSRRRQARDGGGGVPEAQPRLDLAGVLEAELPLGVGVFGGGVGGGGTEDLVRF